MTTHKQARMQGAMTALVTPMRHGDVDWTRLDALVDLQIEAGIDWLVPCGTTGESPTLTHEEHGRVVEAVSFSGGGPGSDHGGNGLERDDRGDPSSPARPTGRCGRGI